MGLPTDLSVDLELRRAKVMAKLLGASPMTVANTNKLVNLFTDDGKAYVDELPEDGVIKVIIPSKTAHLDEMRDSLDEMLPAHLAYDFQHIIHIDDDDDDEESGKTDGIINVDDESTVGVDGGAFLMHANFPIFENIPYGKHYDALKYDGNVQAKSPNSFNDGLRYDSSITYNGIATDTTKVAEHCNWWFVSTGESTFNREFNHDGAIRYDGLKPQEIEFDDGMDEISSFEIVRTIDEELVSHYKFDGTNQFNGTAEASVNQIPDDVNGFLELKRFRYFDGKLNYNGGDINYFNGMIKADGKFNFEGNGIKAQIEILNDNLDGKLSNTRNVKDEPLSNSYPEISDFITQIFDRQIVELSAGVINDTIQSAVDDCNALKISKAIKYNGLKNYDGGDINYFNGAIKADGKFNFEGDGIKAKIELIAIDLDNSFSLSHFEKNEPLLYVEQFDFVSKTYDEDKICAQISFSDIAEPIDSGGNLIVRRRLIFNGYSRYRGNFEYIENARKRFNGNLNYNGVYRSSLNGSSQFNGIERYGSRKNLTCKLFCVKF